MICARFRPLSLLCVLAAPVFAQVPAPTIEGPVSGGTGAPLIAATTFDLAEVGYTQSEYFVSGTASAYTNMGPLDTDGVWAEGRACRPIGPRVANQRLPESRAACSR